MDEEHASPRTVPNYEDGMPLDPLPPRNVSGTDIEGDGNVATEEKHVYPGGLKLALIIAALASSVFLVALDETIIATAIPRITDEFNSLNDVGWYGSAYFLTMCSFQLIYGKLYTFFSCKWVFLAAVVLFEVGSLICAVSPNSTTLIVGRAISGLGSAGINAGYIIILASSLPLERRPVFVSSYSGMYGIATVAAPLMGGAFTTHSTWRWCFYINLPLGAITMVITGLFLPSFSQPRSTKPLREKWQQFDVAGTVVLILGTTCMLLTLQWGGARYGWQNGRIIALLTIFAVSMLAFIAIQYRRQERATIPPRIIQYRSVASSAGYVFAMGAGMNVLEYFLPVWFQAVKGVDPFESGIRVLPSVLGVVLFSFVAGVGVSCLGYYTPFMIAGSVLLSIGAGLMTTWTPSSSPVMWIGYQVLVGAGGGLGIQQAHTAAQTVLPEVDVPTGAVVIIFSQILGSTLFISAAQTVFTNRLMGGIRTAAPYLDPKIVISTGATSLKAAVAQDDLPAVLSVYNGALTHTFYIAIALASLSLVGALLTEWRSVKKKKEE